MKELFSYQGRFCTFSLCGVLFVILGLYGSNLFSEAFRAPIFRTGADKDGFSLGMYNNFQEVFGDNIKMWFLPVFTR
jgi:hypothetical protein